MVAFAQQQGEFETQYMIYRSERVYDPLNIGTVCSVKYLFNLWTRILCRESPGWRLQT